MSRRELPELEQALADLAAALEFPPTPDLAAAVCARLHEAPPPAPASPPRRGGPPPPPPAPAARRRWPIGLSGWRRLAVAGLVAVLLAAAVLVASPGTRGAVGRRLGVRGGGGGAG